MMVVQVPCERRREHADRGDDQTAGEQTADEQNNFRSTFHRGLPIAASALVSGAHPELSRIGHVKCSSLGDRLFALPIRGARAQAWRQEHDEAAETTQ